MKILQVNCVYKNGSTGKITSDIHEELLEQGIPSIVCYGRGVQQREKNVYKICSELYAHFEHLRANLTGMQYGGCEISTHRLINIIKREKPDVVHLQCINGYFVNIYKLITYLKQAKQPTVLTLHAEFMHTANCGHAFECEKWKTGCGDCPRYREATGSVLLDRTARSWSKMKKAFDGFSENLLVVSVSPWLMERAKQSPILFDKNHEVVFNGLDTDVFHYYQENVIKEELEIPKEAKVVFHATPFFSLDEGHIKGGKYVMELAQRLLEKNVVFVVAGAHENLDQTNLPSNMILLGKVTDQSKLAKLYSMADVTLLTSKKETFSMVCAESLCCGTPVVGFKAGAPEMIALKEYSIFVDHANVDALERAMLCMLDRNDKSDEVSLVSKERFSSVEMAKKYMIHYKRMV